MKPKIIKTGEDYQLALKRIEALMDARPNCEDEEELELLSFLVDQYEKEHFPIDLPDPVEAIKFRMEQEGLTRKDLTKYLGSQSKVSEVLAGKRSLSLAMIRSLYEGLRIPAEVLLQKPAGELQACRYNSTDYPFVELFKRGYFKSFNGTLKQAREQAEELLEALFAVFEGSEPTHVYCRKSEKEVDWNALIAWHARVLDLAQQHELPIFDRERLNDKLFREIVKLSYYDQGPRLAQELLNKKGIPLIFLLHLPKTFLDGACFMTANGRPVIGMTLRHDRLDNFWFTLLHELAHIKLHLNTTNRVFFDDTETGAFEGENPEEVEANQFARDYLIPQEVWQARRTLLLKNHSESKICQIADELEISPAIIAGRIRWEKQTFNVFSSIIGNRTVRKLFSEVN